MAMIELVDFNELLLTEKAAKKKTRRRGGKKKKRRGTKPGIKARKRREGTGTEGKRELDYSKFLNKRQKYSNKGSKICHHFWAH